MTRNLPLFLAISLAAGCGRPAFEGPRKLGGVEVPASILERGRATYRSRCLACHGENGAGDGPAAIGLRPAARDFTKGTFKFGGVASGELPTDDALAATLVNGLHGTAMIPARLAPDELGPVLQYLKTFSPRWLEEQAGTPIVPDAELDTPAERRARRSDEEWIALGRTTYHQVAKCWSCHPAYVSRDELAALADTPPDELRPGFTQPLPGDSEFGRLLPPDFLWQPMRTGTSEDSLYRTIAAGVGGTAMPTWKGALEEEQLWALALYVRSLALEREHVRGTRR